MTILVLLIGGLIIAILSTVPRDLSHHPKPAEDADNILALLHIHPLYTFGLGLMMLAIAVWILQII
ncbi:hypothetical protein A2368_02040 [Candidatus Collierbacteria bacterium RIFOXYB1_FULL_49_13]|uniref:Uncharacterized protein n=1 Tax=Candidatus Collierbacteria bacterium RIFOXYB1_FULL_49_13 TaxID=1817728 RepID=A0A1F5FGF5_9BACT|nr:MAG: hypothetical protein A2368_02040 [Candidatus Collierbacteria bacterium RIFOXYB1_FULL_49_13]